MNATELAQRLGVSKARVSQYVSEGKLSGCYQGEGRNRRFDLSRVQAALNGGLDRGQMMGNGAGTRRALRQIGDEIGSESAPAAVAPKSDTMLPIKDPDRYELARTQSAEEDARRKRRDNMRDEGKFVLAEEAERAMAGMLAREIGQIDLVLREAARLVADKLGVDFREVRQILNQHWRDHRNARTADLQAEAASANLSDVEKEADF